MKLAIYDKGGGNFKPTALKAAASVFGKELVHDVNVATEVAVQELRKFTHIVCHLRAQKEPSWETLVGGALENIELVIRVSSVGVSGMENSSRPPYKLNRTWILHLIEPSGEVSEERWKQIFNACKSWDTTSDDLPSNVAAIFDPKPDLQAAIQLLCESWIMNNGAPTMSHNGITVNAPVTPANWFAPFGKEATVESVEEITSHFHSPEIAAETKAFLLDLLKREIVPGSGVQKLAAKLGIPAKTS